ncbi:MAG: hypothetical protein JNL80_08170 [Phycisphaerae bacterium]|jgi:hypothetical protein|nr:hypothetical protein [Phycisphaerae bacterium]
MTLKQHPRPSTGAASSLPRGLAARAILTGILSLASIQVACTTESSYADEQAAKRNAPKPPPVLVIKHHIGGTHHRVIVRGEYAYATFSNSLLTASTTTSTVLNSLELLPFGTSGGAVDLVEVPGSPELVAVLGGTAVLRISLANPELPEVTATRRTQEIGFAPRAVSVAGGEIWISGDEGIVPWSKVARPFLWTNAEEATAVMKERDAYVPPAPFLAGVIAETTGGNPRELVGPVVATDAGMVASVGRRVYEITSGRFVGAASRIDPVSIDEAQRVGESGLFTFILQSDAGAQVGLMGRDVREIDSRAVPGTVRRVKLLYGTVFAVTDTDIVAFSVSRGPEGLTLGEPTFIAVKGARDIAAITDNDYAVVGSFGRALYRWRADGRGEADTFHKARREPSRLTYASTDRRRILAGGDEGSWLYTIGDDVALVNQPLPMEVGTRDSVAGGWGRATVSADRKSVLITSSTARPAATSEAKPEADAGGAASPTTPSTAAGLTWRPNTGGSIHGVESFDGKLWIWHEDGIDVLGTVGGVAMDPDLGGLRAVGAMRIEGPVKYLFPQRVGGAAAYVSEFGGFGVLDFIDRDALPSTGGQRLTDVNADGTSDVELTKAEIDGATLGGELSRIHVPTGRDRDDLDMPKSGGSR